MSEVKILVNVFDNKKTVLKKLSEFKLIRKYKNHDVYYYNPSKPDLKPNKSGRLKEFLRLRYEIDGKCETGFLTYKSDSFKGNKWLYSDESETIVEDAEVLYAILYVIGMRELVQFTNYKHVYVAGDYTIEFEQVDDFGNFLSIEYDPDSHSDVKQTKQQLYSFAKGLGLNISPLLNASKPELMLKKKC